MQGGQDVQRIAKLIAADQREKKYHCINMHSTNSGQWRGLIATLDTGTDENWISQKVVNRLGLKATKGLIIQNYKTFNGEIVSSGETVEPTWSSEGSGTSHVTVFRIVPDAPFDVLFGRNLLFSKEIHFFSEESGPDPTLVLTQVKIDVRKIRYPDYSMTNLCVF